MTMWLAEKTAAQRDENSECLVGVVTIGGERPSVLAEGELRSAELLQTGAVRLPKIGDEVLLVRTVDGDCVVMGRVDGVLPEESEGGEIVLCGGESSVRITKDGKILLNGEIELRGTVGINGTLLINGQPYVPPESPDAGNSNEMTGA